MKIDHGSRWNILLLLLLNHLPPDITGGQGLEKTTFLVYKKNIEEGFSYHFRIFK
jgi:hypothetical protein